MDHRGLWPWKSKSIADELCYRAMQGGQRMPLQAASIAEALELLLLSTSSTGALTGRGWGWMRSSVVVPVVRAAVLLFLVMSVMMLVEKLSMGVISLFVKLFVIQPAATPIASTDGIVSATDEEMGMENRNHQQQQQQSTFFPMALVLIPMYNEKEVPHSKSFHSFPLSAHL